MLCNLERRSFGICTLKNLVYVGGGYLDNEITKGCEAYDVENNTWTRIAHLGEGCTDLSLCNFGDRWIYKFGGQLQTLTLCK
jgi:Kelch motif